MSVMDAWCCGGRGTQRGAPAIVLCRGAGWLSHWGHGFGALHPVASVHGFAFPGMSICLPGCLW